MISLNGEPQDVTTSCHYLYNFTAHVAEVNHTLQIIMSCRPKGHSTKTIADSVEMAEYLGLLGTIWIQTSVV